MSTSVPLNYKIASPGGVDVVVLNNSAFVTVNVNSSTAMGFPTKEAGNRALTPPSYTFVTSVDQYETILSAQCDRVSNYIFGQLEQIDRSDDDQNEAIIGELSNVIGLVGEPAAYTALFEARLLKNDPTILEPLLLALATARHKETEADRVQALYQFANDPNYRVKRAAIRALGRMDAEVAKDALREISRRNKGGELGHYAAALLR